MGYASSSDEFVYLADGAKHLRLRPGLTHRAILQKLSLHIPDVSMSQVVSKPMNAISMDLLKELSMVPVARGVWDAANDSTWPERVLQDGVCSKKQPLRKTGRFYPCSCVL
jgi:hypothetical protein